MLLTFFKGGDAPNKPNDLIPIAPDKFKGPESLPIKHLLFVKIAKFVIIGLHEIITLFGERHLFLIFLAKLISFLAPIKKTFLFLFFLQNKLIKIFWSPSSIK